MIFRGSICALVTPFGEDGAVDLETYASLVHWHARSGTSAIVVAGSTGESAALDTDEFTALIACAVEHAGTGMRVIAGCGAAATYKAMHLSRLASGLGAHASLVVTPYYVRPTQEGLYRHYRALADAGGLPVILYNVPGRTGCDLLPETVARLVDHPQVVAVKEARADAARMDELLALRRPGFSVLSGDDGTATRALRAGADGVISVVANVVPAASSALVRAAHADGPQAQRLDARMEPLYRFLSCEPNPVPVKWLLERMARCRGVMRLPLVALSEPHRAEAEHCLALIADLDAEMPVA